VTLSEGENLFAFQARDRAGTPPERRHGPAGHPRPVITIIAPKGGACSTGRRGVLGAAETGASVKVQGVKAALQDGQFRVNLTIPADGPFTISVEARTPPGTLRIAVAVTLDTVPPALTLTGPAPERSRTRPPSR